MAPPFVLMLDSANPCRHASCQDGLSIVANLQFFMEFTQPAAENPRDIEYDFWIFQHQIFKFVFLQHEKGAWLDRFDGRRPGARVQHSHLSEMVVDSQNGHTCFIRFAEIPDDLDLTEVIRKIALLNSPSRMSTAFSGRFISSRTPATAANSLIFISENIRMFCR